MSSSNSSYVKSKSALGRSENLRKLFELFIAPLFPEFKMTEEESEGDHLMLRLEYFFGVKYRDTIICRARRDFRLDGAKWKTKATSGCIIPAGAHESMVHKGDYIWVRIDLRTPGFVEVETDKGIFKVDSHKWNVYYGWIDEVC